MAAIRCEALARYGQRLVRSPVSITKRFMGTLGATKPFVVRTPDEAKRALEILYNHKDAIHACDTEVCDIDLDKVGPVGNGFVTCASIYSGPNVDFGFGKGGTLWIDNLDQAEGTLLLFTEFFEDPQIAKVWHNYSFDRHVLYNHGIDAQGLGGDTMHMARLWDSSRLKYSLESLSTDFLTSDFQKKGMKELFGIKAKLKDGTEGRKVILPPIETLQRLPETRQQFVEYSVLDSVATWELHSCLSKKLSNVSWSQEKSMMDFYEMYFIPFAEILTDMERRGIYVARDDFLPQMEAAANRDRDRYERLFRRWLAQYCDEAEQFNLASGAQKGTFFFGGGLKGKGKLRYEKSRTFKVLNVEGIVAEGKTKATKYRDMTIVGLGMPCPRSTKSGQPSSSADTLQELAGPRPSDPDDPVYGTAYEFFGGGDKGREACIAIDALLNVSGVEKMVNTFIKPLQELADKDSRVHCSLNLNTETGRLSSRRPNLQNQPALEKDLYKIRDAFQAKEGHAFVVADYGQLELRLLAHITNCGSMIDAFQSGGDFHSRTAMGMYEHVAEAVKNGEVLLEEGGGNDDGSVPLLKDIFTTERRRAKVLNFSIAYGKTAYGLSKDWGVTKNEAQEEIDKWYRDRPEVLEWQQETIENAKKFGYIRTLMGRYRRLPDLRDPSSFVRKHGERAAINTPVQGSAADVMMMGMLNLNKDQRLAELGWKILLQIHDEVIMEGPEESAGEAQERVVQCMMHPFAKPLRVELSVDAKSEKTWYRAK